MVLAADMFSLQNLWTILHIECVINNPETWLPSFPKIEFAPLNVPIKRRLQTLAIVAMLIIQVGSFFIMPLLTIYLIFYTKFWWLCLLYIAWLLFIDNEGVQGNRRSEWVRNWSWWKYAAEYFPVKIVKLPGVELDPARNYVFCYFPHGILSTGAFLGTGTNAAGFPVYFPTHKPYIHTVSLFYKVPFLRELVAWLGGLEASSKAISNILSRPGGGFISTVVVGGAVEAYYCKPGLHKIVYKKRKGIIKLALRHGSPLVPVYSFGETDLYSQLDVVEGSRLHKFREIVKKYFGIAPAFPLGRGVFQYSFGILPHRRPVTLVVGHALDLPKIEEPTQTQIDEVHQKFEEKLIELFDSQKKYYLKNYQEAHLEIM